MFRNYFRIVIRDVCKDIYYRIMFIGGKCIIIEDWLDKLVVLCNNI